VHQKRRSSQLNARSFPEKKLISEKKSKKKNLSLLLGIIFMPLLQNIIVFILSKEHYFDLLYDRVLTI
jgi:hypothetical protein